MTHESKQSIAPFSLTAPLETAPTPPTDALPSAEARPVALNVHAEIAPQVVTELRALAQASANRFGSAIDLAELADALDGAARWTKAAADAERWANYTRHGTRLAWNRPMRLWDDVAPMLRAHMDRDPELAERLPATDTFLRARQRAARKAVATRRRRAAEKKEAEKKEADKKPA